MIVRNRVVILAVLSDQVSSWKADRFPQHQLLFIPFAQLFNRFSKEINRLNPLYLADIFRVNLAAKHTTEVSTVHRLRIIDT